jgi:hypothetical protein
MWFKSTAKIAWICKCRKFVVEFFARWKKYRAGFGLAKPRGNIFIQGKAS